MVQRVVYRRARGHVGRVHVQWASRVTRSTRFYEENMAVKY